MEWVDVRIAVLLATGAGLLLWTSRRRFHRHRRPSRGRDRGFGRTVLDAVVDATFLGVAFACLAGGSLLLVVEHAPTWGILASLVTVAILVDRERCRSSRR